MALGVLIRRYYCDYESEKLIVVDSNVEPEGALVEEISALEFFQRAGHALSCGWPEQHHDYGGKEVCPCGFVFPDRAPIEMHKSLDDEALE